MPPPEAPSKTSAWLWALMLGLGCFGCAREPKPPLERGAGVFQRSCASCHGVGREQKVALGFKVAPPDLADRALQTRLTDADFKRVIREGKGQMPPFGKMLADDEVNDLLAYLRSLARNNPPAH